MADRLAPDDFPGYDAALCDRAHGSLPLPANCYVITPLVCTSRRPCRHCFTFASPSDARNPGRCDYRAGADPGSDFVFRGRGRGSESESYRLRGALFRPFPARRASGHGDGGGRFRRAGDWPDGPSTRRTVHSARGGDGRHDSDPVRCAGYGAADALYSPVGDDRVC